MKNIGLAFVDANAEMRQVLNEQIKVLQKEINDLEASKTVSSSLPKGTNKTILKAWFKRFINKDLTDPDNRKKFFDLTLNSAFIYDKHVDIYINFDVAKTVSFDEYKKDLSDLDKSSRKRVRVKNLMAEQERLKANFFTRNQTIFLSFEI